MTATSVFNVFPLKWHLILHRIRLQIREIKGNVTMSGWGKVVVKEGAKFWIFH